MMKQPNAETALDEFEWLRAFAAKLARPGDEDDLVQDTLLMAWRSPPRDSTGASLRPWLATVARNRARHQARTRLRRERREQAIASTPATLPGPDVDLERVRVLRDVLAALDELPELDRKIIMRRFFNEENATQIGEALGIPAATVRSRLRRSLARLRSTLDERFDGRRDAWTLVLVGPAGGPSVETETGASMMSVTAKITLTITVTTAGLVTAGWLASQEPTQAAALATEQSAPEPERAPEHPQRRQWEQRRDRIRSTLAARPEHDRGEPVALVSAPDASELRAHAQAGFAALRRACIDDLDTDAGGAITLSARIIGDPEVGTVFESVDVVAETVGDPEVIACLTESMYAYLGDKPATAFEARFRPTMSWVGRGEDDTDKDQRVFDAIVGAHHGEIAFCERTHGSGETGTAEVEITVGADRTAEQARVVATDLPKPVSDCIVAASLGWKFAEQHAGRQFRYTFKLPIAGLDELGR